MSEGFAKVTFPEGTTEEEALEFARLVNEATAKMFAAFMDINEDDADPEALTLS